MKRAAQKKGRPTKPKEAHTGANLSEIRFYRANEKPYGVLSNLYRRPILFEEQEFASAEHAYQAGKALKEPVRKWLLSAPSPSLVAMAAHGLYIWDVVPNWSKIKFDRMRAVLRAKFEQHKDLRDILISTGTVRLVEAGTVNNAVNRTWGEVNGKGKNMLGVLLMEIREELRNKTNPSLKKKKQPNHRALKDTSSVQVNRSIGSRRSK